MSTLCTFPGKNGDVLWALPTVRAISRLRGEKVGLLVGAPFSRIAELAAEQDYVSLAASIPGWRVHDTAPMTPREPPNGTWGTNFSEVIHLGYPAWPKLPLPWETYQTGVAQVPELEREGNGKHFSLGEPWIRGGASKNPVATVCVGFTEEWIELKMGLLLRLVARLENRVRFHLLTYRDTRHYEWGGVIPRLPTLGFTATQSWRDRARVMSECHLFLGDLSGLWVLANALGVPSVICEPNPQRHHPVFWHSGAGGIKNRLVMGNDGKPTFDARHVEYEVLEALANAVEVGHA